MTLKNPLKTGAYVRCPRRHELIHAWIGPSIKSETLGSTALRMECAFLSGGRFPDWTPTPFQDELVITSREAYPVIVMCACDGGTSWRVDPRRIPELLPPSGLVDVEVGRVLWL